MSDQSLDQLVAQLEAADIREEKMRHWQPALQGDIPMRIDRQGRWFYQDSEITRNKLVALFAGVLRREDDGQHYLVTPVEKFRIEVELAGLLVVEHSWLEQAGEPVLCLHTANGEQLALDAGTRIRWVGEGERAVPLVNARRGLEALISRPVYYALAEHLEARDGRWVLRSHGAEIVFATDV